MSWTHQKKNSKESKILNSGQKFSYKLENIRIRITVSRYFWNPSTRTAIDLQSQTQLEAMRRAGLRETSTQIWREKRWRRCEGIGCWQYENKVRRRKRRGRIENRQSGRRWIRVAGKGQGGKRLHAMQSALDPQRAEKNSQNWRSQQRTEGGKAIE